MLCALDFYLGSPREIAIIGSPTSTETQSLLREIWRQYLPNKVVAPAAPNDQKATELIPLLRDRQQLQDKSTVYVCENFVCKRPVNTPPELAAQLLATEAPSN
jgi:uncharacterized protein YyaL (SSP411 family)